MILSINSFLLLLLLSPITTDARNNNENLEQLLLSIPDPQRLKSVLYDITQKSHVAGTKGDWDNAYYVRDKLRSFGYLDAHIEPVQVMLTYPQRRPSLSTSFGFQAKLSEDILDEDSTSGTTQWRNHTFLAYSPSGIVTSQLVYANYGRPEDFDVLEQAGVSVNGSIVLMRYGECFRGLKLMNAEERGAIGSIIYSDPQQDGNSRGPTFPQGPWRPPSGVQRGSVQHNSKCAGDPWRLYLQKGKNKIKSTSVPEICGYETKDLIPKHPAIPISYEDALPLLEHLGGTIAPENFQGGLDLQYHLGPSDFDVTIQTNHTFFPRKIPNVIATLYADDSDNTVNQFQSIILGNHRDAWVFGAVDPNSGTTSLLEVARTLKILQQNGWKPQRNIVFASWSGEEYGLLGSTAYAELREQDTISEVIAYLNVDCAVTGNATLTVSASHSLNTLFRQAAEKVPAPPPPSNEINRQSSNRTMANVWNQVVGTLGSGSDYTVFLDRYGIASLDMSFQGDYGVYHSVYDSFSWMEQQGDPSFEIHQSMTRLWALMAFRLTSSGVLPIYITPQAEQMKKDVQELKTAIEKKFGDQVDMAKLEEATQMFSDAAIAIDSERELYGFSGVGDESVADINRRLSLVERQFLGPGLPKRKWFRHLLQAPGFFLGYGSQSFPGIAGALLDSDVEMAKGQIQIAANAVSNAATYLQTKSVDAENNR